MWSKSTTKHHEIYFDYDTKMNEIAEEEFTCVTRFWGIKLTTTRHSFVCNKKGLDSKPGFKSDTK